MVRYVRKQDELGNVLIHRRTGGQRLYQAAQIFQESWASYIGDLPRALDFCGLTEYRYLSRRETANLLRVSPVTLSRWKKDGSLLPEAERPTIFPRNPPFELYYDPVAVMNYGSCYCKRHHAVDRANESSIIPPRSTSLTCHCIDGSPIAEATYEWQRPRRSILMGQYAAGQALAQHRTCFSYSAQPST